MGAIDTVATTDVRKRVSEAEWQARVELAACYRLLDRYGMTDLVYNHATARVPGTEHILINAYGYLYREVKASNLVKIDLDGAVVLAPANEHGYGINQAGHVIHSAVHRARGDVACVIHTHTRAGMAVSAMAEGLLPLTQTAMRFYGRCAYHDYESVAIDLDEQSRLVADLGTNDVMILRNHGLLAAGASVAEAFNAMYWLEMACRAQVDAMAAGARLVLPPEAIRRQTAHLYDPAVRRRFGLLEWPAMLREVERLDPDYRN